jgi:hypothetical protein
MQAEEYREISSLTPKYDYNDKVMKDSEHETQYKI